jgi:hypothetical protein
MILNIDEVVFQVGRKTQNVMAVTLAPAGL